jgi:hypothetical protein
MAMVHWDIGVACPARHVVPYSEESLELDETRHHD